MHSNSLAATLIPAVVNDCLWGKEFRTRLKETHPVNIYYCILEPLIKINFFCKHV